MATGYTQIICDGCSFKEFAMLCARAMGVCVEMRDEPLSKEIPKEFVPSPYHKDEAEKAKEKLKHLYNMTKQECSEAAGKKYTEKLAHDRKAVEDNKKIVCNYKRILSEIEQWEPPTPGHDGLKKFMLEQVRESLRFDGIIHKINPKRQSGEQWRTNALNNTIKDINYHEDGYRKEVIRARSRTEWVKQLRNSL